MSGGSCSTVSYSLLFGSAACILIVLVIIESMVGSIELLISSWMSSSAYREALACDAARLIVSFG